MARLIHKTVIGFRYFSIPPVPVVHKILYHLHVGVVSGWNNLTRIFWYTPIFQSRLEKTAPKLYLYGGMPYIEGGVKISIGNGCRVGGGKSNITGRSYGNIVTQLIVGDNCDLGWGSVYMVGNKIIIGNNVRLAAGIFLAGYSGHAQDAVARARGDGDLPEQIGDIILEDDVWLATGVTVLRGVTIGQGTIVGAASVVTKDLPPFVLAAGNPARVIRKIENNENKNSILSKENSSETKQETDTDHNICKLSADRSGKLSGSAH